MEFRKFTFKKVLSLFCALALVLSAFAGIITVSAEETGNTENTVSSEIDERIETEFIKEVNYDDPVARTDFTYPDYQKTSCDVYGAFDPLDSSNRVLRYQQSWKDFGLLHLGYMYNGKSVSHVTENTVKAEANTTYLIEYDYLTLNQPMANTTVTLSAGLNNASVTNASEPEIILDPNNQVNVMSFSGSNTLNPSLDTTMTSWSRDNKVSITLPADFDAASYPYLVFYIKGGGNKVTGSEGKFQIYFDNIKISKVKLVRNEVIAYNSYDKATVRNDGYDSVAEAMGVDAYPTVDPLDPHNKVVKYSQGWGYGFAVIGSDCQGNQDAIAAEAITAEAGKTYNIQFDYYATGTTASPGTIVRFAVGQATKNYSGRKDPSWYKELFRLDPNSDVTTDGWIRDYKATVTIPEGTNFTNGDKLLIQFVVGGANAQFYIDNIKVSTYSNSIPVYPATDREVCNMTFNAPSKGANSGDSTITNVVGNLYPSEVVDGNPQNIADPLNPGNTLLRLMKYSTGDHMILLGCSYQTLGSIRNYEGVITPKAGVTYKVAFDWYTSVNPEGNDIKVNLVSASKTSRTDKIFDFKSEILRIDDASVLPTGWSRAEGTFTVPSDTVITDGNFLALYVDANIINNTGITYFDNITLTEVAPISVELNVNGEHSSRTYADAVNAVSTYPVNDYKAVMWYEDKDFTVPFSPSAFETDAPTHLTLYGQYVSADTTVVIGDIDKDSLVNASDLTHLVKILLGIEETYDLEIRYDSNGDKTVNLIDLVSLKKIVAGMRKSLFAINGNTNYQIVVPTEDANFSEKNSALVSDYIGTPVADTAPATDCEIIIGNATRDGVINIQNETNYSIVVKGNKVFVNGGSDNALAAAILSLKGYIEAGYNLTEGTVIDFDYVVPEHPADMIGVATENPFQNDFVTNKESNLISGGEILNPAATISLANGSISENAVALGNTFAADVRANKIADFEKSSDFMVHVSSFVIIDDVYYMTYYANDKTAEENPIYQSARLVYSPVSNPLNKTYITLQSPGDNCYGKTVKAVYDTILMQKDSDTLYLLWTANLDGNYYRLYRTYTISTKTLSPVKVNKFKVGNVTNDFSVTGIKSALAENEIAYKDMYSDIGIMQKVTTRVENGVTYYYTGAYCGDFNCIIKSSDMKTWEYVAQPDFINQSKWENATYVIGDKCYYFVRQNGSDYGFLTCYDLVEETWATPVLIEDVQSRSDFIMYNGKLFLFHAPKNNDGIAERQHLGVVYVDTANLANSQVVLFAYMGDSCFYPYVQYSNNPDDTNLYISYTVWRKHIRLSKFDPSKFFTVIGARLAYEENFSTNVAAGEWSSSPYKTEWVPQNYSIGSSEEGRKESYLTPENISVENGILTLKAKEEEDRFESSEIRTLTYYNYGYFEIKAKINASQGICPAFWLLGSRDSDSKIEYEVDIFECFGKTPDEIKGTLLAHNYPNGSAGDPGPKEYLFTLDRLTEAMATNSGDTFFNGDWGDTYHTFGLDWRANSITWYIDGVAVMRATLPQTGGKTGSQYSYDEPMRVILTCTADRNTSNITGLVEEGKTDWENGASLQIDYVRVYQY